MKNEFWAQLDKLGEDGVIEGLATKRWGEAGDRQALAEAWQREKVAQRNAKIQREQTDIARSARDAAWASADAAKNSATRAGQANTRATIALVIAGIAAAATIIVPFLTK